MQPFIKVFGSEVGNGLSPFAVNIQTPRLVTYFLNDYLQNLTSHFLFYCIIFVIWMKGTE